MTAAVGKSMRLKRVIDPKEIDAVLDPRVRGGIAHQTLYRFYSGLPKRLGTDAVEADRLDEALVFLRECLAEAIAGGVRLELSDLERLELHRTAVRTHVGQRAGGAARASSSSRGRSRDRAR